VGALVQPRHDNAKKSTELGMWPQADGMKRLPIESVSQMRSWPHFGELIRTLQGIFGAGHVSPQILDAADFGVAQTRRRLFVLCGRERPPADLSGRSWAPAPPVRDILDPPSRWECKPLFSAQRAEGTRECKTRDQSAWRG
jgi:DNA (cytosine-5)-methyltransferase 1